MIRFVLHAALAVLFANATLIHPAMAQENREPAAAPLAQEMLERIEMAAFYQTQYANLGEALNGYMQMGVINATEKASIETFLKSKKVDMNAKFDPLTVSGATVKGPNISLTFTGEMTAKTHNGVVLSPKAGDAKDKTFMATYNALTAKSAASSVQRMLVPEAQAFNDIKDPVAAVLVGLVQLFILTPLMLATIVACGIPALVIVDSITFWAKKWIFEGKVECRGRDYSIVGYNGYFNQIGKDYARYKNNRNANLSISKELDAAAYAACWAPISRNLTVDGPNTRARYYHVHDDVVAKAFKGGKPACTPDRAKHLKKHMDGQAKAAIADAQKMYGAPGGPNAPGKGGNKNNWEIDKHAPQ